MSSMTFDDIRDNLSFLDDWEDKYRFIIDLGRTLAPLPEDARDDAHKVHGCASQVWLLSAVTPSAKGPVLSFTGDSDAHIVKGLVALMIALHTNRTAQDILALDARAVLKELGLAEHLTAQRSNGLHSMVQRMRGDASAALQA